MLEVKLICIGKLKEKYWRDAVQEYAKRLSAFCRFQIIELNEARLPQDPNAAEIAKALGEESKAILRRRGAVRFTRCALRASLSPPRSSRSRSTRRP